MNFLITGATGFIGGRLATQLVDTEQRVVALCRDGEPPKGCHVIRGELEDLRVCERAIAEVQPDVVFHLAAQAIVPNAKRDPFNTLETNVRGTYNLLEAFRRHRKDRSVMVVASSDKAYGELTTFNSGGRYSEKHPLEGRGPYDVSKSCADLIAQSYAHEYGLPIGIVRAGNVYGPGDSDKTRIVPSLISSLREREQPVIMSDGTPVRDYLWIDDATSGYLELAWHIQFNQSSLTVNLAGGEPVTVKQLVELAIDVYCAETGAPRLSPLIMGIRKGEIRAQVLSTDRAKRVLDWKPAVDLREGLRRTLYGRYNA